MEGNSIIPLVSQLDPLSLEETKLVKSILQKEKGGVLSPNAVWNHISLLEPPKLALLSKSVHERNALVVIIDAVQDKSRPQLATLVWEAVVSLSKKSVESWKIVPNVQPTLSPDDCYLAEEIALKDAQIILELKNRGIDDLSLVSTDMFSPSYCQESYGDDPSSLRLVQLFFYTRMFKDDNEWAHPLDLVVIVDITNKKIFRIDQRKDPPPTPKTPINYTAQFVKDKWKLNGLKPIEITQPLGPSFKLTGRQISWYKWNFHIGFNYREGLVLNLIHYDNRPIIYRASLAEMAVPYADPEFPYHRKIAFDVGDYGLGFNANSLQGCHASSGGDCFGTIQYLDAIMNNHKGEPLVIKNAICIHEEDAGLLWKHVDHHTLKPEVRRNRRLVVSFIASLVNYEYAFYWYFYLDGTIQFEPRLTGILSTTVLPEKEEPKYGTLIAPQVNGPWHQRTIYPITQYLDIFNVRLDMMVDGINNSIYEINVESLPHDHRNPRGNAFMATETLLKTEKEGQRIHDASKVRHWKVVNHAKKNSKTGNHVGYVLVPTNTVPMLAAPSSMLSQRAFFATKNLWVTPYEDNEKYPAGDYPNQSKGDNDGLLKWTKQNRSIENTDIVLWYSFGPVHIPRPEDFPVMPAELCGFYLKPFAFFEQNPTLDLPPTLDIQKQQLKSKL